MKGRWSEYFVPDDFVRFWIDRLIDEKRSLMLLFAVGFDPRCLEILRVLTRSLPAGRFRWLGFRLTAPPAAGEPGRVTERLLAQNLQAMESLNHDPSGLHSLEVYDHEGHHILGRRALGTLHSLWSEIEKASDVLVDISGMPRGMFFPLISYLDRRVAKQPELNLHVGVVEDPEMDRNISGSEYGQADYLQGFRPTESERVVWAPLVGMGSHVKLERIHEKVRSACIEICPLLPFPAVPVRQVDDVVLNQSSTLEALGCSWSNFILCDETSPFDVYRKLCELHSYYVQNLSRLPEVGTVTTVVSPLSSKTLSLGVLLAAIENQLPVCHIEPTAYQVAGDLVCRGTPKSYWIAGEPYLP
jgi:hypothetical protein